MAKYLIIVPVLNCKESLPSLLPRLPQENTIIVDDGSIDGSLNIITESGHHFLKHNKNLGVGASIKTAVKYGLSKGYTYAITIDADLQHDPIYLEEFEQALRFHPFVIGNRFLKPNIVPDSKLASNLLASLIIKNLFGIKINDPSCGFRAFPLETDLLNIAENGYGFLHHHLMNILSNGITPFPINIDCIYSVKELWCTRKSEIVGFLKAAVGISRSNKAREGYLLDLKNLLNKFSKGENIKIDIKGHTFHAFYIKSYDAFIIQLPKQKLYELFTNNFL